MTNTRSTTIKQGDTAPDLVIALTYGPASTPVNLTGATVRVVGVQGGDVLFTDNAPTIDAAAGMVTHEWVAPETDATGPIKVEVQVTYSDGKIQSFPPTNFFTVTVLPDLDA